MLLADAQYVIVLEKRAESFPFLVPVPDEMCKKIAGSVFTDAVYRMFSRRYFRKMTMKMFPFVCMYGAIYLAINWLCLASRLS